MSLVPGKEVLVFPHPHLKRPTRPVTEDDDVNAISKRMVELMISGTGVGIAANQCGYDMSILVLREGTEFIVFINPEILETEGEIKFKEGCLSFPGIVVDTKRHSRIKVAYDTLEGERKVADYQGFPAIVIQHEVDHLRGITFIDKLPRLKRDIVLRKMNKWHRQQRTQNLPSPL